MMIDHVGFPVRTASRRRINRTVEAIWLLFAAHDWAKVVCLNKGATGQMQGWTQRPLSFRYVLELRLASLLTTRMMNGS
jgi:hypothetical protein